MSDQKNDIQRFKYDEMANKVLKADRRFTSRRNEQDAIASQPKSLKGKITKAEMGSRLKKLEVNSDSSFEQEKKLLREQYLKEQDRLANKPYGASSSSIFGNDASLINSNIEGLTYFPKKEETVRVFEQIISWVYEEFSHDVTNDVIRSAADALLVALKDETIKDKRKECEEIINNHITDNRFNQLVELANQITDFHDETRGNAAANSNQEGEAMPVTFDDENGQEEDDEEEDNQTELQDDMNDRQVQNSKKDNKEAYNDLRDDEEIVKLSNKSHRNIPLEKIDPIWLQLEIKQALTDADSHKVADFQFKIFSLLSDYKNISPDELKNELLDLFHKDKDHASSLIGLLCSNRLKIYFRLKLLEVGDNEEEKLKVIQEMNDLELYQLMEEFENLENNTADGQQQSKKRKLNKEALTAGNVESAETKTKNLRYIDLNSLKFDQGSHLMTKTKINLPQGSFKKVKKSYEEIHVPAPSKPDLSHIQLISTSELPEWAKAVFPEAETSTLNPIQSAVYPVAFKSDSNMLLCAPTGAGKTNVAMLAMLRAIDNFRNSESGRIDADALKIVYIAPLKALVQEQVREFSRRLKLLGLNVGELTGDSSLTKQQIKDTQVLITTPEKWDVITRKNTDTSYTNLVRLIIIDEIHLLHDERGPVLESIVARTLRQSEELDSHIRLVGLSATLPNYKDVAEFLQVDFDDGLFYFDASYRPCPLAQQFIGITEQKAFKKVQAINEACYDKVLENAGKFQVIIFVHSRKDTVKTATYLRDKLLESENLTRLLKTDAGSGEILKQEASVVKDAGLKELIPTGFAVHHAGLTKEDRSIAEDLFAEGYVQVLVSTATLAWGVNLPAHTVIIKGTQVYSPEKGAWTELSPQDILQMLGRAGRPRYDKNGEGVIITSHSEMQYYLAILNQQLPIESQLVSKLVDNLNAEIVAGTVRSLDDGVEWLGYSYLFHRMLHSPGIYHVGADYSDDEKLLQKRADLIHSALVELTKNNLVHYDEASGAVSTTELGRIASYYYISNESMNIYIDNLRPYLTPVDILRIFALSGEFKYIPARQEEKQEIKTLISKVPIPVKESESDPLAKVNVLLQSYISKLNLEGFALMADMVYITQSASRIFRAIYEICLRKNWAGIAKTMLDFCKMIDHRMWLSNSPFRQFPGCPREIVRKTETARIPWSYYLSLETSQELGQAIGSEKFSRKAFELIQQFPKIKITETNVLPITTSLLKFELTILPEWQWNYEVHGASERFLLLVEDVNGEKILFNDTFLVRQEFVNEEHYTEFTLTLPANDTNKQQIVPPNYFVSLVSEKWLNCDYRIPITFFQIRLPKKFSSPTEVVDMPLVPTSQLKAKEFEAFFAKARKMELFNKFQSQAFAAVYQSNEGVFIGASKGSGKTVFAELAIFNYWKQQRPGRVVYICPTKEKVDDLFKLWNKHFASIAGGKQITKLSTSGELSLNLKKLNENHLILSTPENFELITKRWTKNRKFISKIDLLILDDAHAISHGIGSVYEVLISRIRFIMNQLEKEEEFRLVALASPIANGRDFADWLGIAKDNIFNFDPTERVEPVEVHLRSLNVNHYPSFINSLTKSSYKFVTEYVENTLGKALIFISSRTQAIELATFFIKFLQHEEKALVSEISKKGQNLIDQINDIALKRLTSNGIGIYYKNMNDSDRLIVDRLFQLQVIKIIFATRETSNFVSSANLVLVLGTQYFEGKEHRYVDYTANELQEMIGLAQTNPFVEDSEENAGKVVIFTTTVKRDYYKKFLNFAIPVESTLHYSVNDVFVDEITNKVITTKQDCIDWLTYTFFYRRLQLNPSFYGVKDVSALGLSEFLSELIEDSLKELEDAKMIEIEENDNNNEAENEDEDEEEEEEEEEEETISPLNGAMISSHYSVSFNTIQTFMVNLISSNGQKFQLRFLIEILSLANEFESLLTMRKNEAPALQKLYNRLPLKSNSLTKSQISFENSISLKVFILLQAHLLRLNLSPELNSDSKIIISVVLKLLNSMIDLLSSDGNLIVLRLMTLSQLITQAIWEKDENVSLKQLPFVDEEVLKNCASREISNVNDFLEIEDDDEKLAILGKLISSNEFQLNKVINFLNNYPIINNISYKVLNDEVTTSDDIVVAVTISRDEDIEDEEDLIINSEFYPYEKFENWWIVIGDIKTRTLYAIKKVVLKKEEQTYKLSLNINDAGKHDLNIWLVCDSYYETEETSLVIDVAQGENEDDEDEEMSR